MTHSELIEIGARFLKHQGYWMWLAEPSTTCVEKPDLIAWKLDASILIECKVSRADFINYPRGRAPGFVTVHRYRRPDTASRL